MSHRKTDLGIPHRSKSAKVVLVCAVLFTTANPPPRVISRKVPRLNSTVIAGYRPGRQARSRRTYPLPPTTTTQSCAVYAFLRSGSGPDRFQKRP